MFAGIMYNSKIHQTDIIFARTLYKTKPFVPCTYKLIKQLLEISSTSYRSLPRNFAAPTLKFGRPNANAKMYDSFCTANPKGQLSLHMTEQRDMKSTKILFLCFLDLLEFMKQAATFTRNLEISHHLENSPTGISRGSSFISRKLFLENFLSPFSGSFLTILGVLEKFSRRGLIFPPISFEGFYRDF